MQLFPVGTTVRAGKRANCWSAESANACFEITLPSDGMNAGWKLLHGILFRRGGDYDARLYYDLGEGYSKERSFQIPTSGKGVINEVVLFPEGIKRLRFSPMSSQGEFELSELSISNISAVERAWRMMRRVVWMYWLHPRQKRRQIGLSFSRVFANLQSVYDAANKLLAHAAAPEYPGWLADIDVLGANDVHSIERRLANIVPTVRFSVLVIAGGIARDAVQKTLLSLEAQFYRCYTSTVLALDASNQAGKGEDAFKIMPEQMPEWLEMFNAALAQDGRQEWVIILQAGDVLAPHALYWLASEVSAKQDAAIIYADDDEQDALGQRCRPRFKPDWSLAHLRATNFVGDAVALRGDVVASAGGLDPDCFRFGNYDLLLRVVDAIGEDRDKIVHIPAVLLHTGIAGDMTAEMRAWNMAALRAHLVRNGVSGEVSETLPGCWRVRYRLPESPPLVSIIVPTRDRLELIQRCLESVLEKTTYPRYEILVVDNQSADPEVLAFLDRMGKHEQVRVLRYDRSFNFSAMNNLAVEQAKGEVVCLLNNDTEVISPDWLDEMIGHLLQSKVGVVGAKLYFPDGRVQHAGDLVGVGGVANHAHAFLQSNEPGYCNRAMVAQDMSAVTAACMVTRRSLYLELGGLDEKNLPVAFNDVDYCLRASEAGYRVIWTPYAELYHHESVSRGKDLTPEKKKRAKSEVVYMRKRWRRVMRNDPYYNPNLSYERPDFSLSHAPMVKKPWVNGK